MNLLTIKRIILALTVSVAASVSTSVCAGDPFGYPSLNTAASTAILLAQIPIEKAIKKAKAKYGGKVLSAKEITSKGPLVYKIKILLPNGRVKTVFVDGESGEVFEA